MARIRKKLDVHRSSPSHSFSSSSSSDFEFTVVSSSPRKSSTPLHRTADELFYKGQLLPLHLSPRLSMVRTLHLLPSSPSISSTSSSSYASSDTTASRASTASTSSSSRDSCDSSARPSSVLEDFNEFKRLNNNARYTPNSSNDFVVVNVDKQEAENVEIKKSINNYFSLSRFSNVFKKDPTATKQPSRVIAVEVSDDQNVDVSGVRRASNAAKEVIRKYMKKVKPLYEKLSQKQQKMPTTTSPEIIISEKVIPSSSTTEYHEMASGKGIERRVDSFSGNLKYPRRRACVATSCPSSMDSSPNHSGVLSRTGLTGPGSGSGKAATTKLSTSYSMVDRSSMDELQSAIQGAIAHCKNSMV